MMGWRTILGKIAHWTAEAAQEVGYFGYKGTVQLMSLVGAVPRAMYSMGFDRNSIRMNYHLALMIGRDVLLPAAVLYSHSLLHQYLQDSLKEDEEEWLSTNTLIQLSLLSLQGIISLYQWRKYVDYKVHNLILNLEMPKELKEKPDYYDICKEKKCSLNQYFKAASTDPLSFMMMDILISNVIGRVPYVGEYIAQVLIAYNKGRYIVSMAMPKLCSKHLHAFLKQHPEVAATTGSLHLAIMLLTRLLDSYGVPRHAYEQALSNFLLMQLANLLAHSYMPRPVNESNRRNLDPIVLSQHAISRLLGGLMIGVNKLFKDWFKQENSVFPWSDAVRITCNIFEHPAAKVLRMIFLPIMFIDLKHLTADPFIKDHWDGLRKRLILIANTVADTVGQPSKKAAIKLAAIDPNLTASVGYYIWGTPKILLRFLIMLASNKHFVHNLKEFRRKVELMDNCSPVTVTLNKDAPPLRKVEDTKKAKPKAIEAPKPDATTKPGLASTEEKPKQNPITMDDLFARKKNSGGFFHSPKRRVGNSASLGFYPT